MAIPLINILIMICRRSSLLIAIIAPVGAVFYRDIRIIRYIINILKMFPKHFQSQDIFSADAIGSHKLYYRRDGFYARPLSIICRGNHGDLPLLLSYL